MNPLRFFSGRETRSVLCMTSAWKRIIFFPYFRYLAQLSRPNTFSRNSRGPEAVKLYRYDFKKGTEAGKLLGIHVGIRAKWKPHSIRQLLRRLHGFEQAFVFDQDLAADPYTWGTYVKNKIEWRQAIRWHGNAMSLAVKAFQNAVWRIRITKKPREIQSKRPTINTAMSSSTITWCMRWRVRWVTVLLPYLGAGYIACSTNDRIHSLRFFRKR